MRLTNLLLILCSFLFCSGLNAQTQEEIERMLNGSSSTEEVNTKKEKEAKAEKPAQQEAVEEIKTTIEPKKEKVEETKVSKEPKEEKAKEVKEEKVKEQPTAKEPKIKEEKVKEQPTAKEAKVKEEKVAKEEKVKVEPKEAIASSSSSSSKSSSSGSTRSSLETKPYRTWSVGVFGGLTNPVTDIRYKDWFGTIDPINENQWNAGIRVTKMFDAAFGLQFRGSYNVVQGAFDTLVVHQEDRRYLENAGITDGTYFRNNVVSSSLNIYWNISNTVFGMNRYIKAKAANKPMKPRKFSLYAWAGVGGTWFDPHVMRISDNAPANFPGISFQDGRTFEINIPVALGTKFNLGKSVDLGFEYALTYVFTDKLDGFVFNHPDRIKNDLFTNVNMTLDFKIGSKKSSKEHIEWVQPTSKVFEELGRIDEMDRKLKKLTTDDDNDGVSDYFDKDTDTEAGLIVDGSGVALDSDRDGIPDKADLEPFSDQGAEVDEFGVSLDTDGDGVPNHKDVEPDSPKGSFVNFQGVSIDGKVKPAETRGVSFPSVFFDTDKATIKREYEEELFMVAKDMLRMEKTTFLLSGHCDERGSDEYNNELGQRRADEVKKYLVENYGISADRIKTISKGKSEINSPRFNVNRRVDIMIIEK